MEELPSSSISVDAHSFASLGDRRGEIRPPWLLVDVFFFFFSKQTTEIDESKFRPSRPEPVRGFFLLSIDCSATNPIKLIRSCLLADCTGCLPSFTELFIVLPQHWFDFRWIFTMLPCSVVFYRVFVGYYRVFIYLARSSLI